MQRSARRTLSWIALVMALSTSALAQPIPPPGLSEADKSDLAAFGKAFSIVRSMYIEPLPAKALVQRALHGLATAPLLARADQHRVIAATMVQLNALGDNDVQPLLRLFGSTLDALRATAGTPQMDGMLRAAIAGMVEGLDARTGFTPARPPLPSDTASSGLKLIKTPQGLLVLTAYFNGPAGKAGVQRGDHLISIDGRPTKGLSLETVIGLLRGPAGSSAQLGIQRDGVPAPMTVEITRAVVKIPLVSGRQFGAIAYLHVDGFEPGTAQALRQAFSGLQKQAAAPFSGIILDLRDNGGGRLTEAVAVADELLPPSTLIATTTGREAVEKQRFTAATGDITGGLPMVVLVNELTASGSEIVAAALQHGRGAIIMGGHTNGAGRLETVVLLPPLGALQLTTEQIVLASGQTLAAPGLLPQIALIPPNDVGRSAQTLEAKTSDPMILRLRRGIPQTPQTGEKFDSPDMPGQDFEMRQACAAIAMLNANAAPTP